MESKNDSMPFVGCKTDCNNQKLRGKCTGFNCCQTTVPSSGIQRFNVTLESTTNNMNTCKHAFVAETQWLESNKTDPSNDVQYLDYVPVALAWTSIINLTFTEARRRNMYLYTSIAGASYYYCLGGYEGNPSLSMRCQGKLLLPRLSFFPNFLHYMPNFDSYISYFKLI